MATYPTGTYAPATKVNGNTITAAMFNDPEGEIIAVEDALRNGLAHALTVSTGGLTVSTGNTVLGQNLSVAGASTLATVQAGASTLASLQVNGATTFAGAVTFSGAITGLPLSPPSARLTVSTTVNVSTAWTGVNWDIQSYATSGMHSTSANSSRLVFAPSTGKWHVWAAFDAQAGSTAIVRARLVLNDSVVAANVVAAGGATPTNDVNLVWSIGGDIRVTSTADYVTVQVMNGASTSSLRPFSMGVTAFGAHQLST